MRLKDEARSKNQIGEDGIAQKMSVFLIAMRDSTAWSTQPGTKREEIRK